MSSEIKGPNFLTYAKFISMTPPPGRSVSLSNPILRSPDSLDDVPATLLEPSIKVRELFFCPLKEDLTKRMSHGAGSYSITTLSLFSIFSFVGP